FNTSTSIVVDNPANFFGGLVSLSGTDASLASTSTIDFGSVALGGNLSVIAAGITDTSPLNVAGATTLSMGPAGDIVLDNPASDFSGPLKIMGGNDATLSDANDLELLASSLTGNLSVGVAGNLTLSGLINVGGVAILTTGANLNVTGGAAAVSPSALVAGSINVLATAAVLLTGGAGDGSYAALRTTAGNIIITTPLLTLTAGGGIDADAVILASGNVVINATCTGCNPLFANPLGNGITETGVAADNIPPSGAAPEPGIELGLLGLLLNDRDDDIGQLGLLGTTNLSCSVTSTREGTVISCAGGQDNL
ncbi:MAG: hypothetical protein ACREUA_03615, partial [Burkholderiales bacterium]